MKRAFDTTLKEDEYIDIRRSHGPADGPVYRVEMTPTGAELVVLTRFSRRLPLTPKERQELIEILKDYAQDCESIHCESDAERARVFIRRLGGS